MANQQIPNLPAAIALNGTEQLEGVQAGTSVKLTVAQLGAYITAQYPMTVGATPIAAGTSGRILYDNAGILGEYTAQGAAVQISADYVVASLAALKALTTTYPAAVLTQYRSTVGDQGGGTWVFRTGNQSANVTADPASGIWAAPNSDSTGASGAWQRQYTGAVDPRWFGAVGDGSTDDTTAWNRTIASGATIIDGAFKTYKITSALTGFVSNQCLQNASFDFSTYAGGRCIQVYGTIATALSLTANTAIDTSVVQVANTSTLSSEALVFLTSNAVWSAADGTKYGQYARIKTVDSGTQVTLFDNVSISFTTADTAKIALVTPVRNVLFKRVKILGDGTTNQSGIYTRYAENITFDECDIYNIAYAGIDLYRTYSANVSGCRVRRATAAGLSYGVVVAGGCYATSIVNLWGEDCRHAVTIGGSDGINLYSVINSCHAISNKDAGFDSHSASLFTIFSNNTVDMSAAQFLTSNHDGMISQGAHTTFSNNIINGARGAGIVYQAAFDSPEVAASCIITANKVRMSQYGLSTTSSSGILVLPDAIAGPTLTSGIIISNNEISGGSAAAGTAQGIYVYNLKSGATYKNVKIIDNVVGFDVLSINGTGIFVRAAAGATMDNVHISGCSVKTSGDNGIYVLASGAGANITNTIIEKCTIDSAAINVRFINSLGTLSGATIENITYLTAATKISISGTVVDFLNMDAQSALPSTVTNSTVTIGEMTDRYVFNRAGTVTVTLPSAVNYPRRTLEFVTIQNQTVVSAASNVVPIDGGAAGTAIIPAVAGAWVTLKSNGTDWVVWQTNNTSIGSSLSLTSGVTAYNATAIPAGGTAGSGYNFSSTANFGMFFGSGAPTLSAAKGSLYLRSDGSGTGDRAYINTDGATTWTALTTAA